MWLVAGLGNPDEKYADTRHNVGFMVINALAARFSIPLKQKTTTRYQINNYRFLIY